MECSRDPYNLAQNQEFDNNIQAPYICAMRSALSVAVALFSFFNATAKAFDGDKKRVNYELSEFRTIGKIVVHKNVPDTFLAEVGALSLFGHDTRDVLESDQLPDYSSRGIYAGNTFPLVPLEYYSLRHLELFKAVKLSAYEDMFVNEVGRIPSYLKVDKEKASIKLARYNFTDNGQILEMYIGGKHSAVEAYLMVSRGLTEKGLQFVAIFDGQTLSTSDPYVVGSALHQAGYTTRSQALQTHYYFGAPYEQVIRGILSDEYVMFAELRRVMNRMLIGAPGEPVFRSFTEACNKAGFERRYLDARDYVPLCRHFDRLEALKSSDGPR